MKYNCEQTISNLVIFN